VSAVDADPGDVLWVSLAPTMGREQSGRRPVLVVSGVEYGLLVDPLVIVVPVTSVDRGWPNHVPLTGPHGLDRASFAMSEQPRTVSRQRLHTRSGAVDDQCLCAVRRFLGDFLQVPSR
jgi:mRNA interferase MazF